MAAPTTLFEYYTGIGLPLPPVSARAQVYQNLGLGSASGYTGTAAQNTVLLNALAGKSETPPTQQPGREDEVSDAGLQVDAAMSLEEARAIIEQYRAELSGITVADIRAAFTPETIEAVLGMGGITITDVMEAQAWFNSLPPSMTMYDLILDLMSEAGASPGDSAGSGYQGSVPELAAWDDGGGSGAAGGGLSAESPVYEVDRSGAWSLPGAVADALPSAADAKFIAGEAVGSLYDGASTALSDIVIDDVLARNLPTGAFNALMSTYDGVTSALNVRQMLTDFYSDVLNDISRGFDQISSNDPGDFDNATFESHVRQFQNEASDFVVGRFGAGGEMLGNAMSRSRVIVERFSSDGQPQSAPQDGSMLPMAAGAMKVAFKVQSSDVAFSAAPGTGVSVLAAAAGDRVTGAAMADLLVGQAGNDVLSGMGGNDTLVAGGGRNTLDGGAGRDTAVFSGARANYAVSGAQSVTERTSGAATTLTGIERVEFADKGVAFDVAGNAGMAYRLYQAAFDRRPDEGGLGYQINALDQGLNIAQVAANFIASPEFSRTYGSLNDTQYVTQLYQNVLDRAPDAGGLAFHVGNLASGANIRANVLVGFSESPENQVALIGVIQGGMVYAV